MFSFIFWKKLNRKQGKAMLKNFHIRESLVRTKAIAKKETKQLSRDVRMLAVIFLFPVFLLIMFGYAINFDVHHIKIAVYDLDKSSTSRDFINSLQSSDYFDLVGYLDSDHQIKKYLDEKLAQCVIVIPENLSREVNSNRVGKIQFLIDGVDGNTATITMNYVNIATINYSSKLQNDFLARKGMQSFIPIQLEPRFWYNPELNSTRFLLPGLIGMILIIVAVVTIALSIVREKERGTIEQINVSPLSSIELMIGKTVPYIVIALINATMILLAGYILFGIVIKGSFFWLTVSILVFLFASLCLGLLVSTIAESQQVAFQIGTIVSMIPSLLLSGFIFPIDSMPVAIQIITNVTPAKFFIVCLRSILLKGEGIAVFWDQLLYMVLFSLIILAIAMRRYIKNLV
jgi:ABC-2 type transport system permease protein